MDDLRLLAIEADYVVLENASGQKFRLAVDEEFRRALRGERASQSEGNLVSPRIIQEMVRSGATLQTVADNTGASIAYIEKFALSVLDEINHVVGSASSVRIPQQQEKFGEPNFIEFGQLIRNRLEELGASEVSWSARRPEGGPWQIRCEFSVSGLTSLAIWSFDVKRQHLSPENEVALNLAHQKPGQSPLSSRTKTKLPFMNVAQQKPEAVEAPPLANKNLTSSLGETQEFAEVIPFGRGRGNTQQVPVVAAGTSAEIGDDFEPGSPLEEAEDGQLFEALRRQREIRETNTKFSPIVQVVPLNPPTATDDEFLEEASSSIDETAVWIETDDELVEVIDNNVGEESQLQSEQPTPKPTSTKRGRASMPSWDQIVFGTRSEPRDDPA